jgi:hypothetical protein
MLAPLGGVWPWLIFANLAIGIFIAPQPGRAFCYTVVFIVYLVAVTSGLVVLTDFYDYRLVILFFPLAFLSTLFILRIPSCPQKIRMLLYGYCLALSVLTWSDVRMLHGKLHESYDYGILGQESLNQVRNFLRRSPFASPTALLVERESFCPIMEPYGKALAERFRTRIYDVDGELLCKDPQAALAEFQARVPPPAYLVHNNQFCTPDLSVFSSQQPIILNEHVSLYLLRPVQASNKNRSI